MNVPVEMIRTPLRNARKVALLVSLCLLAAAGVPRPAGAQQTKPSERPANTPMSAEQVVQNLVHMNQQRAQALHSFQGSRTYRVEYRGFPGSRSAEMVVAISYQAPATKEFTIQSSTGSKLIIDKVFKKLLEGEKEALGPDMQRRTALNDDNYRFTMSSYENTPSGATYVLLVEPKRKDKFLYAGRIWVDAVDFAVKKIEAEPAKNPSFWTKNSEIQQEYKKVKDFWLPARNHSISTIRLGGKAELTIDYGEYQIQNAGPVVNPLNPQTKLSADSNETQR